METKRIDLGEINIREKICVTDPSFDVDAEGTFTFDAVPGKWRCAVDKSEEDGIITLYATTDNVAIDDIKEEVGVGELEDCWGIFDYEYFQKNNQMNVYQSFELCRILDTYGIITPCSYWYDGQYKCYVHRNDQGIVNGIRLDYILED